MIFSTTRSTGVVTALALLLGVSSCSQQLESSAVPLTHSQAKVIGGVEMSSEDPLAKATLALLVFVNDGSFATCTAVAISRELILTAAHCLRDANNKQLDKPIFLFIQAQKANLATEGLKALIQESGVRVATYEHVAIHPNFKGMRNGKFTIDGEVNDIAVVRVATLPDSVVPLPLLRDRTVLKRGIETQIAGYGPTKEDRELDINTLRKFKTTLLSGIGTLSGQVLVRSVRTGGILKGDSGGPASVEVDGQIYLWGLSSNSNAPGSSDVSRHEPLPRHLDWIERASQALIAVKVPNPVLDTTPTSPVPTPEPDTTVVTEPGAQTPAPVSEHAAI